MVCPRCGLESASGDCCPRCGAQASSEPPPTFADDQAATLPLSEPPSPTPPPSGPSSLAPLGVGQEFGPRYHIIGKIGSGGMGSVYQAWDRELSISVALKVLRLPDDGPEAVRSAERRLKQELLLARQVTHKNVVRIHDLGEVNGVRYLTMPYIQGRDLWSLLKREGRLPVPRALSIARQVAAGLCAAHEVGVIHRDLKPANILIDDEDHAVILDFGIAYSPAVAAATVTAAGQIKGTIAYMSPEQGSGTGVDARTDVYSFGLIVYEMLSGLRSTDQTSSLKDLLDRMKHAPPAVRSLNLDVPSAFDGLVSRCLEPDAGKRFQSAGELEAALQALDANGHPKAQPVATDSSRRPTVRRPLVLAAALGATVAVAAATWLARAPTGPEPGPIRPQSLLVANFVNATGDGVFDGTVEEALTIGLESATFLNAFNRREATRLAALVKSGAALNEEAARLIAIREGIDLVLGGRVEAEGAGYRLQVRAVRPEVGDVVAEAARPVASKDDVLDAIGLLARDVRRALGDSAAADGEGEGEGGARETFTAATLDAAHAYTEAQRLSETGRDREAVELYQKAVDQDPNFGRALSGLGVSFLRLGQLDEAQAAWKRALSLTDRMTDRERYRTLGLYYMQIAANYEQAIENNRALVERYPGDSSGFNNLAVAYFNTLDFARALEAGRRAIELNPRRVRFRANEALYAMYASDFAGASRAGAQAVEQDASYFKAYLPLAMAAIDAGDHARARDAYQKMSNAARGGASLAAVGLADLALYEGRPGDAIEILNTAAAEDEKAKNTLGAASKSLALGDAQLQAGRRVDAVTAAARALNLSRRDIDLVPAARLFLGGGRRPQAASLAAELNGRLTTIGRAYGRLVDGWIALDAGRAKDAVAAFLDARKLADLWLARFSLGVAYVQAGAHAEALSELDTSQRRRGEATAVFLDDVPTARELAALPYWLGRAQEGLGQTAAAATSYRRFLDRRPEPTADPLAADARRRLGK
jgi:tetratricopeptide (TPR) repeat protein